MSHFDTSFQRMQTVSTVVSGPSSGAHSSGTGLRPELNFPSTLCPGRNPIRLRRWRPKVRRNFRIAGVESCFVRNIPLDRREGARAARSLSSGGPDRANTQRDPTRARCTWEIITVYVPPPVEKFRQLEFHETEICFDR